jgi:membrane associated rhomboid family serine protease
LEYWNIGILVFRRIIPIFHDSIIPLFQDLKKKRYLAIFPIRDTIPSKNTPFGTWAIILVNSVVFVFELMMPESVLHEFFYYFGIVPARYSHPEWAVLMGLPFDDYWPFLTSMFLHGGWLHIIGNMWTLYIFGDNVEDRMGTMRFLVFYFICGLAAGLVHVLTNLNSTIPTVGASGAIAGVLGAYFLLYPNARVITLIPIFFFPLFVEIPAITYLGFWILSQIFSGVLSLGLPEDVGGVAFWAHVGGFIVGAMIHWLFVKGRGRIRALSPDEWGLEAAWRPLEYSSFNSWRDKRWL